MSLEPLLQPPINHIDLTGEWDGDPTSQVTLHAKIEFVSVPNTRLPLLDLSNDGVGFLQYEGPTKLLEASRLPYHLAEISDEKHINGSTRGRRRGRQHPTVLNRITNGGTEPLNETPRTLYRKGMELSPPSTKRRLFPPSPTSTLSRLPSFDGLVSGLEDDSLFHCDDEDEGYDGGDSRSTDVSAIGISENSGDNSAAHSFGTARAVNGDPGAEMEAMLSDLEGGIGAADGFKNLPVIGFYDGERRNLVTIRRRSDTCNRTTSSLSSATMTPKPKIGAVSKIPVKAQRLVRPSGTYEELSHSSESEGNLVNTSASPSKTASPPSEVVPVPGNGTPPLMSTTPRNEQFSPVKLSNTLPADLTKPWVDKEPPQSPTRKPSHEIGKQVPLFDRYSLPQPDPRGFRRHTQLILPSDAAITTQKREKSQKDNERSEYISTWLETNECNGFAKDYPQSRFLYPTGYSTELENGHEENSPTCAEGLTQNTAIPEQNETEKLIKLPSPSPSSQLSMPWNSAEELARKCDSGKHLDMVSPIPAPELAIVEELGKDFYILCPETTVPTVYTIEFDLKIRLGPLQPGGWQLLSVPGLPIDKHGGKGTVRLTVLDSSTKKKLGCRAGTLLGFERDGTGYIGDFDIAEPFVLLLRAVEQLTSESRDNRILNHEISVDLRRHRRLGTGVVVEYTAVCALSMYQKILCSDEGSIAVIISDGPGGDFEFTMENGNRDFHVDQKAASASDIGTTKIKIFCKENELDGCFRIAWEVPYERQFSQTWVPKLFFEKPATQAEYVPSLRSQWGGGLLGTPTIEEEIESRETTTFEMEMVVRKLELEGLGDWGYLGLPAIETESITYWCMHQLVRVVILFIAILQELGVVIHIYLEYVPLGPMKILLLSLVVQAMVLFNQHLGRPSIESQISPPACPGLPCPRSYVQIEPRLGSFGWFAREKAFIVDRGLLGHIFNVVSGGWEVTFIASENDGSAEKQAGKEGELQNMVVESTPRITITASPTRTGVDSEDGYDPPPFSNSNLPQTELNSTSNNPTALEPTATGAGKAFPTKPSLRDRIDRFLGWKGPVE
ncbi:hypothetical protein EMCG_03061 [[Emmonsia] crescens]|uniref:Uncharacterized protein n=1 Tax=[Emmonsia] crescens TaxID=73230 RepID=A0A0G2J8N0_9EURO|nr:hypothetical protein EMCG_03061 [Emmonsia crescens UAMH 3008]